ncbi:sigma-70 family RNA polymerase sigma factor [Roseateles sp. DAIF2]|uniref:RNA polymerase subunit sigma-70 n=1 Tax=Roseateles sp. DAIF2 TaxID=2714952 RepID=UPI0018A298E1|nr:RNA polymerase subunit sigma-70 [Roseateles sp. DAIF2]QPF73886.1 sigma-70 family RNA polymerase sigma factor [Roseateles sp. DAIF2]
MPAYSLEPPDPAELARARAGDDSAFERLLAPWRRPLHRHCYRLLGSPLDADDALQETLLAAWRGLAGFEARSALGTWLYRIATHVCLRLIAQRPRRLQSPDYAPPLQDTAELGEMVPGPVWLEPLPEEDAADPAALLLRREQVALAFVSALQHLPGRQRAVLLLREVLEYSAAETAELLDSTVAAVNSALQRAQASLRARLPGPPQELELQRLGEDGLRALLADFVGAWERRDLPALLRLFTEDARFTMPPLPAWFDGRHWVGRFIAERVFATPWRLRPLWANGQPGFACYMGSEKGDDGPFRLGAIVLLSLREGRIAGLHSFLEPALYRRFGLAEQLY